MRPLDHGLVCALAVAAASLGACSSDVTFSNVTSGPTQSLLRPDWLSFSGHREEFALRQPGPNDLVSPEGQCAGVAPVPAEGEAAASAPEQGGIALQMTECDVVRRAGPPERVEFGGGERGERTVVLTYIRGSRPGIYRFAGGRLVSIERAPEPAAAERPAKRAQSKKRG